MKALVDLFQIKTEDLHMLGAGAIEEASVAGVVISTLPTITCILLFLSPIPTVQQVMKEKSTGKLPAVPYISMAVQCVVWTAYGVMVWSLTVIVPNFIGIILGSLYAYCFQLYASDLNTINQLYCAALVTLVILIVLMFQPESKNSIGIMGMILTIFFNFSPLVAISRVCRTKSVASMPFHLSFLVFWNSFFWILFGWFVRDDYLIWLPNVLGILSGSLQLFCHMLFGDVKQSVKDIFTKKRKHERIDGQEVFDTIDGSDFEDLSTSIELG